MFNLILVKQLNYNKKLNTFLNLLIIISSNYCIIVFLYNSIVLNFIICNIISLTTKLYIENLIHPLVYVGKPQVKQNILLFYIKSI